MKSSTQWISGASVIIFFVAGAVWLLCLSKINTDFSVMRINYIYLLLAALAAYIVNTLLMRRGISLQIYAAVQIVMMAGAVFVFLRSVTLEPLMLRTMIINCVLYVLIFPVSGFFAYEAPKNSTLLVTFDLSASLMAILLILDHLMHFPAAGAATVMCVISLLFSLLALIAERSGRIHVGRDNVSGSLVSGKLMLAVLFAAVVGLTAAIAAVASVGIRRASAGIVAAILLLWSVILSVLRWLYRMFEQFMYWLSQFFEPVEADVMPATEAAPPVDISIEVVEATLPPWLTWAAIGIAVAFVIFCFWKLRNHKFNRVMHEQLRKPTSAHRKNGAGQALRWALQQFFDNLQFRLHCILRRNTVPGLLIWCERNSDKENARRPGESGEAFLRRLADTPEREALTELADLVEQAFYAPGTAAVPAGLPRRIRRIRFSA